MIIYEKKGIQEKRKYKGGTGPVINLLLLLLLLVTAVSITDVFGPLGVHPLVVKIFVSRITASTVIGVHFFVA